MCWTIKLQEEESSLGKLLTLQRNADCLDGCRLQVATAVDKQSTVLFPEQALVGWKLTTINGRRLKAFHGVQNFSYGIDIRQDLVHQTLQNYGGTVNKG